MRVKRLIANTKRCIEYHRAFPGPIYCEGPSPNEDAPFTLFAGSRLQASSKLPPVPFLVPAIIEALLDNKEYQEVTFVVPGEADLYCARFVSQQGGIVLTGDSDLLVHDLGSDGAVSFFRDIESPTDGMPDKLHSYVYHIPGIIDRLGLPSAYGIKAFAFELFMDPHGTFRKLLMQATSAESAKAHKDLYRDFILQYELLETDPSQLKEPDHDIKHSLLQCLDPRISEYVLQFNHIASIAGLSLNADNDNEHPIHIFLPMLLDCPTRTNAWETSTSVRLLAYALINLMVPEDQRKNAITEHVKQLNTNGGRHWQLPVVGEIPDSFSMLAGLIKELRGRFPGLSGFSCWAAVALYQDVEWSSANGKALKSDVVLKSYSSRDQKPGKQRPYSWDLIHLYAQVQGSYYSFRILKQLTDLFIAQKDRCPVSESITSVAHVLESLPKLQEFPDLRQFVSISQELVECGILRQVYDILGTSATEQSIEGPEVISNKNRMRRKRKVDTVSSANRPIARSGNPFELLEQEQLF